MSGKRKFIHIQGQQDWCKNTTKNLLVESNDYFEQMVYCGSDTLPLPGLKIIQIDESKKRSEIENYLGGEHSILVLNAFDGFNPDLFCALCGLIKYPGLIILLSPKIEHWPGYPDPDYSRFCSYPYTTGQIKGRFITFFTRALEQQDTNDFLTIAQDDNNDLKNYFKPIKTNIYYSFKESTLSYKQSINIKHKQKQSLSAIQDLVHKQSAGIIVIHGNRGRGKSTSIGLALVSCLAENNGLKVSIISQNRTNVRPIFDLLNKQTKGNQINVSFFPPDEYLRNNIDSDLVIIDEAAAIPLKLLKQLIRSDNKTVISTTTDGYEGSGMGFMLKFQNHLAEVKIPVTTIELQEPCRWSADDPIEKFIFSVFFPQKNNHETVAADITKLDQITIQPLSRDELVSDMTKVQQLFGLLAQAHYRTTPDDLRYILDAADIEIWKAELDGHLLAAMIVAKEGLIEDEYLKPIWLGQRRLNGHLIPQTLSSQNGFKQAIGFSYKRIVRIATKPQFRNLGIATRLVEQLESKTSRSSENPDFIGVSFGYEQALFKFWQRLKFKAVRLSHRENARSGLMSLLMLNALSDTAADFCNKLEQKFYSDMDYRSKLKEPKVSMNLSDQKYNHSSTDWQQLRLDVYSFAFGYRQYLNCQKELELLANYCLNITKFRELLNQQQANVLTFAILQNKAWHDTARLTGLSGKAALTRELRNIYSILYRAVWGNKS